MKFANKKAQSAMEYLMTYGWAILIVIIVAAALYALGVFNPATFTGRTATGFQVIGAPSDWDLNSSGGVTLVMSNSKMSTTLTIINISATISGNSANSVINYSIGPGATNQYVYFAGLPTQTQGATYSLKLAVLYNSGGIDHTDTGTVTGVVS